MNTFQLNCFLAVANTLSFARAAERLHVTQPAVTHQIRALEDELNAKLFRRSTRMVELTAEGQSFITDARNMVEIAEQARRKFSAADSEKIETISIGLSNYAQFESLAETLHRLSMEYPNLHPNLQIAPQEQLFHLLETGSVDIVFGIRESVENQENLRGRLKYRELVVSSLAGVCRRGDPCDDGETLTLEALRGKKLIFSNPFTMSLEIAKVQTKLAADKNPADIHFCGSAVASYLLAAAGMGVAVIPELFVPKADCIATVKILDAPKISYGTFYEPDSVGVVLKRFMELTAEYFAAGDAGNAGNAVAF